LARIQWIKITK